MIAELKRRYGPLVPDDAETFKHAPPGVRPDDDAVYEEITQVNPADPPVLWLRKLDDERPLFTTLPHTEIELVRRLYRHAHELMALPGVWGIGMAQDGFHINIDPTKGSPVLPTELENVPIIIDKGPMPQFADHGTVWKRPLGAGLSVGRARYQHPGAVFRGALGPFVVFDVPRVLQCCNVYHTTAGHVLKHNWEPFPPPTILPEYGHRYGSHGPAA